MGLRHSLIQMLPRIDRRKIVGILFLGIIAFVACTASIGVIALQAVKVPPNLESSEKYTVLINTWKRHDLLIDCVSHYAKCGSLDSLRVVWSESREPPESLKAAIVKKIGHGKNVIYDIREENSLNSRMQPLQDLHTDAVFSVDDDVFIPCRSLELAFNTWRSSPNAMVGFVPRAHLVINSPKGHVSSHPNYGYGGWWYVWWHGSYSMILSKAAFFHQKYFAMYTNELPQQIRDYVTRNRNCEDIAMSMLVANATSAPPIWVQGRFKDLGSSGISSKQLHWQRRSTCLNDFATILKTMPLITGHIKVTDSRRQLFW